MKMKVIANWSVSILSAATMAAAGGPVPAGQTAASPAKEKEFKGKVEYVNNDEHIIRVDGFLNRRTFYLGNNSVITRWDNSMGYIDDLRPGEKVTVGYQNVDGVTATDRVEEQANRCTGVVKIVDPETRHLVLRTWEHDKPFVLSEDCKVVLHNKSNGPLASIKPGDHVTVMYETPSGQDLVRQIAQTGVNFTGSLVVIDLPHRMIATEGGLGIKQFNLADDCSIVMNGGLNAPLISLRPGQRLTINYDEVNGVNVANRIAPAENEHENATAQLNP
jgi:Cu/Ag efflux protein CusF